MTNNVLDEIKDLFLTYGFTHYGEACDQIDHAISSAEQAQADGATEPLVIAAFLHDIGHFIADAGNLDGLTVLGHPQHHDIGANWLAEHGFPRTVTEPIRHHVNAKRYRQDKVDELSPASLETLQLQGGQMSSYEAAGFEANEFFNQALKLRQYDDGGKPSGLQGKHLAYWLERLNAFYQKTVIK